MLRCGRGVRQPLLHTNLALVHDARESLPSDGNCATVVEDNAVRLVGHIEHSTSRLNVPAMGLVPVLVGEGPEKLFFIINSFWKYGSKALD